MFKVFFKRKDKDIIDVYRHLDSLTELVKQTKFIFSRMYEHSLNRNSYISKLEKDKKSLTELVKKLQKGSKKNEQTRTRSKTR